MVVSMESPSLHMPASVAAVSPPAVVGLTTRSEALQALHSQDIRLPNLSLLFEHWPARVSPDLDRLQTDVDGWLDSILPQGKALNAFKASDFALFGASWWPCAPFERLRTVTYIAIWLFIWDDEIDSASGSLWEDWEAAQEYRLETIRYVRHCLGLVQDAERVVPCNAIIRSFELIGSTLRDACSISQRQMIYEMMEDFMQMSEREQRLRLDHDRLPTIAEFWDYRLGASAVFICLAVNEYAYGNVELPAEIFEDPDMRCVWKQTNIIISAVNDILSLKKEIARGAVDSVIPIMYVQLGSVQAAMNATVEFIEAMIKAFDDAAQRLLSRYSSSEPDVQLQLRKFIDGAKYYCTGNFTWSLKTRRYNEAEGEPKYDATALQQ